MNPNDTAQVQEYVDSIRRPDSEFFIRVRYLYKNPDPAVRLTVADLLANSNDPEARKYLRELMFDPNRIVRQRAERFFWDDGFNLDELLKDDRTKFEIKTEDKSESQPNNQRVYGQQINPRRRNRRNKMKTPKKGLGLQVPNDLSDFLIVEGTEYLVTKDFLFPHRNWTESHFALSEKGLYMPRIDIFLEHYKQFIAAINGQGNLYDGNRIRINDRDLEELKKYRLNHYFHLDAIFYNDLLITDHRIVNGEIVGKHKPLITCLDVEGMADFSILNSQGLPIQLAEPAIYDPPKAMRYTAPYIGDEDEETIKPTVGLFCSFEDLNSLFCTASSKSSFLAQGVLGCRNINNT
nr:hypothetical protein [Nanoarchaeum sp.]